MPACASAPAVYFRTMGCAKNEVDSQKMADRLAAAGYRIVEEPEAAEAIVVNTCSFIEAATEESLEAIFDLCGLDRVEAGEAKVIVAGCMPARYGDELEESLDEVRTFIPCSKEDDIVSIFAGLFPAFAAEQDSDPVGGGADGAFAPGAAGIAQRAAGEPGRIVPSAYVKISDGCDRFCSFCSIPYIRGRYRSFPLERIEDDVRLAIARGAREVILIAQDTGRWGDDFEEPSSLPVLVRTLAEVHPDTWFRIMYLQPEGVTDELLGVIADHGNVLDYLDIPLQHVDPQILKAMHRRGSREDFLALLERIRAAVPGITLRTTLIAGFPGETEAQFEALLDFLPEAGFDYVGVFPYSQEDITRAAKLPGQLPEEVRLERAAVLQEEADRLCTARIAERRGSRMEVLVLGHEEDGQVFGRARCQSPDVDGVVYLDRGEVGQILEVTIEDTLLYEMEGA